MVNQNEKMNTNTKSIMIGIVGVSATLLVLILIGFIIENIPYTVCFEDECFDAILFNESKYRNLTSDERIFMKPSIIAEKLPDEIFWKTLDENKDKCKEFNGQFYELAITFFCVVETERFLEITGEKYNDSLFGV